MRLTCTEDGSSKFWEGTVEGASLTVFFGKIGTKGQTKTKEFPSAEKAQAELAKLIKEKLGKGYVEASPGKKPAAAPAMQESTKVAPKTEAPGKESPKKAGGKAGALARALAKLDPLVKEGSEARLRPGASDAALAKLSKTVLGGKPVPEDLETWFRWHDGQKGFKSFSSLDNRMLMTLEDAIETWKVLSGSDEESVQPWKKSWLPLLENGAGDHLVYVLEGEHAGALIGYWHTDEDRKVEHASLLAWAEAQASSFTAEERGPRRSVAADTSGTSFRIGPEIAGSEWKKIDRPASLDALSSLPVGTVIHRDQPTIFKGEQYGSDHFAWVKVKPDLWLEGTSVHTRIDAIAGVNRRVQRTAQKPDHPWQLSDKAFFDELGRRKDPLDVLSQGAHEVTGSFAYPDESWK